VLLPVLQERDTNTVPHALERETMRTKMAAMDSLALIYLGGFIPLTLAHTQTDVPHQTSEVHEMKEILKTTTLRLSSTHPKRPSKA